MTSRDRAIACKTLVCLIQGIEGYHTTIELRNENSISGTIDAVDVRMNINLTDVTFQTLDGNKTFFEQFYVKGIHIRFVHIPDEVDMLKTIEGRITTEQKIGMKGKFEKKTKADVYKKKVQKKYEEMKAALGK